MAKGALSAKSSVYNLFFPGICDKTEKTPLPDGMTAEAPADDDDEGVTICGVHIDQKYLAEFEIPALTALAREMGLEVTGAESKAELVERLAAQEVKVPFASVVNIVDGE